MRIRAAVLEEFARPLVVVRRYLDGEIDVDPFISHRISLDEVNRGFELMEAQDGIRSVIEL
jgi:S-(hydroxymethyl)glutathione dehydrogenase/alcohol dehydrogenase